jgi:hypothetical protein
VFYCVIVLVAPVDLEFPVADFFDVFAGDEEIIFIVIDDQYTCEMLILHNGL